MISDSKRKTPETPAITTSNSQSEAGSALYQDIQIHTSSPNKKCHDHTFQQSPATLPSHSAPKTTHIEEQLLASNQIQQTIPTAVASTEIGQSENGRTGSSLSTATSTDGPVCILCDEPATVRLLPCGHEIICLICSKRAKKCLQCKVGIVNIHSHGF